MSKHLGSSVIVTDIEARIQILTEAFRQVASTDELPTSAADLEALEQQLQGQTRELSDDRPGNGQIIVQPFSLNSVIEEIRVDLGARQPGTEQAPGWHLAPGPGALVDTTRADPLCAAPVPQGQRTCRNFSDKMKTLSRSMSVRCLPPEA